MSAAFVPGSLFLYAIAAVLLAIPKWLLDRSGAVFKAFLWCIAGLVFAWALLLPWSATWFAHGGPLDTLIADDSWRTYTESFRDNGMLSTILGQTPDGPALFGLALPLLGIVAIAIGTGSRRRMALALWAVVIATGWIVDLISVGLVRPLVPSPTEAGVLAALAYAGLAGLAVGAFRLDLSRRQLGAVHAVSIGALSIAAFLILAGIGPSLWRAEWTAGRTAGGIGPAVVDQVSALLDSEAQQTGPFRALWIGSGWTSNEPAGARPGGDRFITGARSPQLNDLFSPEGGEAEHQLDLAVASIEEGTTDRGGELLGAFNVNFVIIERGPRSEGWLAQRDLGLIRSEPEFFVLRNQVELPRAAVYNEVPIYVQAIEQGDPRLAAGVPEIERKELAATGRNEFGATEVMGPGVLFLATVDDPGWIATADGQELAKTDEAWGNTFQITDDADALTLTYPRSLGSWLVLLFAILAWTAAVGAAVSRRRAKRGSR